MTTLREAAQQALWAFQYHVEQTWPTDRSTAAIAALRAALAQQKEPCPNCASLEAQNTELDQKLAELEQAEPVQEPVAWMVYTEGGASAYVTDNPRDLIGAYRALALYTAPPQRKPLTEEVATLIAQRDALLEALKEADDLLRIARGALWKLGLNGLGSDTRLSHEVRMFALEFSAESRDGPGVLQVNGTGRALNALKSICAAIKAVEEGK